MIKAMAWAIVKPFIKTWISDRALKLPATKVIEIAKKMDVPPDVVVAINQQIIDSALVEFDKFKP